MLFTSARLYLKSPWLRAGAALAVLIVLPNLVWQAQHQWIGLQFTAAIHARDISIGRTVLLSFLHSPLYACTNIGVFLGSLIVLFAISAWFCGANRSYWH